MLAKDYPPTAYAGTDVILHLPEDSYTLNGNGSSDDKVEDKILLL